MVFSRNDNNGVSSTIEVFGDQAATLLRIAAMFSHTFLSDRIDRSRLNFFLQWLGMSCLSINTF